MTPPSHEPAKAVKPTGGQQTEHANANHALAPYFGEQELREVYTDKFFDPLKLAVLDKFGVGRGEWRRSDELNAFRQRLKDAARKQASLDIANQMDDHQDLKDKSNIGKAFFGMAANKEAYSMSKISVDAIMDREAERIIEAVKPAQSALSDLRNAAYDGSSSLIHNNALEKDIKKRARSKAQDKAKELLKSTKDTAVNEARKIVKGDKDKPQAGADTNRQLAIQKDVTSQVKTDEIGKKSITKAIESDSLNSGLTKIGGIIDRVVPHDGDAASLACELKIPIGQSGGYVIISFEAGAERDEDSIEISSQIGIGVGVEAGIVDFNVQLGMFAEANAATTSSAMNLISYGMYRYINASVPSLAESMWGMGGKSGKSETEEAEMWASAIEAQDMDDEDSSVSVGTYKQLALAIESGIAEVDLSLTKKSFNQYDKKTIMEHTRNKFGDQTDIARLRNKALQLMSVEEKKKYEVSAEIALNLGFGELGLEAEGALTKSGSDFESIEISMGVSLPFEYGGDNVDWVAIISKLYSPSMGLLTTMNKALASKDNGVPGAQYNAAQKQGSILDAVSDTSILSSKFDSIGQSIANFKSEVDPDTGEVERLFSLKSQTTLGFSYEYEWGENGQPGQWEVSLELGKSKSFEIDADVFSFSVEKTKKIAEFGGEKKKGVKSLKKGFAGF
ncbi:hypothetical protein [Paenibacillus sp. IITD108]|uniref:hypothetical protein n=1 Tax=Paenibacillus sp. IITD108 TaxID=3116649 RepID=UPI002F3EA8E6